MPAQLVVESELFNTSSEDAIVLDGRVRLGGGAKILAGTIIEPPVLVAAGARVLNGVEIGAYSYVGRNSIVVRTRIGRYCSIAHDCQINYFASHPMEWLSTHPFQYDTENFRFWDDYALFRKGPKDPHEGQAIVSVGSDAWIGTGAYIFGGCSIADGAVVGARAMVRHDIPPYAVAVGAPATIRRYRFTPDVIERLLATRWWTLSEHLIRDLPFDDVEACLKSLEAIRNAEAPSPAADKP